MDVYELTDDQVADFKAVVDPVVSEYIPQFSQEIYDAVIASKG